MNREDLETNQRKLEELRTEHRDLDDVVERLAKDPSVDPLELRRLKKRKLHLKDIIKRLESESESSADV